MDFLGNILLHDNHGLVVRIPASGTGGPGSHPGEVSCGMVEE